MRKIYGKRAFKSWRKRNVYEGFLKFLIRKETLCILCSLFCFGYCFLIYSIKSGTRFYLIWGMGGLFFLGLAFFLHFALWTKLPPGIRKIIMAVVIACILLFVIVEGCIISAYRAKGEADLDYLIVLGAQVKEKGPSAALKFRLDTAYDYLIENENTICIVSGGQERTNHGLRRRGCAIILSVRELPKNAY